MRRIWIGIGILVALLGIGMAAMEVMDRQLETVTQKLEQASETENWDEGVSLAREAQTLWNEKWTLMGTLSDHSDMDSVDELFAQLEVYQRHRAQTDHAATCARLCEAIRDLKENHRINWWNLL